jgi:23S rRNA (guanosine2251-2'-O)-methyltransferase
MKKAYILLHDIRSVHNVGSIFRTSDALGITKIFLTGHTPTPLDRFGNPRKDFAKVALGAEKTVPWEYSENAEDVILKLKKEGLRIVAIEQSPAAVDYKKIVVDRDTLFIFGNEVEGVSKNILELADAIAEIPMKGAKESLNISVAFGAAMFRILNV